MASKSLEALCPQEQPPQGHGRIPLTRGFQDVTGQGVRQASIWAPFSYKRSHLVIFWSPFQPGLPHDSVILVWGKARFLKFSSHTRRCNQHFGAATFPAWTRGVFLPNMMECCLIIDNFRDRGSGHFLQGTSRWVHNGNCPQQWLAQENLSSSVSALVVTCSKCDPRNRQTFSVQLTRSHRGCVVNGGNEPIHHHQRVSISCSNNLNF